MRMNLCEYFMFGTFVNKTELMFHIFSFGILYIEYNTRTEVGFHIMSSFCHTRSNEMDAV